MFGFYAGSTPSEGEIGTYFDLKTNFEGPDENDEYDFTDAYARDVLGDSQTGTKESVGVLNIEQQAPELH